MQIGRYEILEIIGEGASGRVARAFDPMIGRTVAIKLLLPELARGAAREDFLREARVVGQLTHPHVITLHDMGIDEATQTPYLVMEFFEGEPLDRLLKKGSIPFPRACAWVGHVASALAAAHRKGIIHGDVKPANILISEERRIKLTDFGMARLASRDSADSSLLGTPAYWCPEQIFGKPQDGRSDIFSLGVVLYEMVTGRRPFAGETPQAICSQVISDTPILPSNVNPSLPVAINRIIERCLAKEPVFRFADGNALAAELYPLARRKVAAHAPPPQLETAQRRRLRIF